MKFSTRPCKPKVQKKIQNSYITILVQKNINAYQFSIHFIIEI